MKRRRICGLAALAAGLVGVLGVSILVSRSQAQPPAVPPGIRVRRIPIRPAAHQIARADDDDLLMDGVFLPPDRQSRRRLEVASDLIQEGRYGEAVRLLGALLDRSEDFLFRPEVGQPVFRSLKAEAGRLLAELPAEGRESYELQFGAAARKMLAEAAAASDMSQVSDVSRRFFFTQAGAEATYLLGRHYMDQNRPLAAALCFERLLSVREASAALEPALSMSLATCWLRAAEPNKAQQVLARLREAHPGTELVVGGKRTKLFNSDTQALAWMEQTFGKQPVVSAAEADQWAMFRGDETRNAQSGGSQPLLSLRWRQRTADDQAIEDFVSQLRHEYWSQQIPALPSMHPLAVSDVVLMRTAFALQAVDIETGKLVWRYSAGEESLEQFLRAVGARESTRSTRPLLAGLDERMWDDATYGMLASDGRRVYYVEDLGLAGLNSTRVMTVLPNGQRRYSDNTQDTNRLAARELRTEGKLKWAVGGVTGEDCPELAGAFFLGPPLPLMGHLYVLAEVKGQEIRLLVLSPDSGQLEWSQHLAVVDVSVAHDPYRRKSGATPSFADGVLVCPTSATALVGVDLTTRSLLWGYQYPETNAIDNNRRMAARARIYETESSTPRDRWVDASVTIADGHVLANPIETDKLYCLRLADGQELWTRDRGDNLYVACVDDGRAIVVGQSAVTALSLADGKPQWELELPDDVLPSGRGFYSGHDYYLPLTSAEVVKINLASGEIESRARSRFGNVPGNLICYRDTIVSQGTDYLDAYYQLDALKERIEAALAANPDDPRALAALGEVKLDEGPLSEAVALFRRSYALEPDETTRGQLIESLLEGLRVDFAAYRDTLEELDKLVEQPRHRLEYLRLKATGLQAAGEVWTAFDTYLELIDEQAPWEMEQVDDNLSVRRDRWIREQLAELRMAADPQAEEYIDSVVNDRFEKALATGSTESLRAFVRLYGAQPAAARAGDALVAALSNEDLLEKNLLLERRILSPSDAEAAAATAQMAAALTAAERSDLANVYYQQLATRFAKTPCLDGKTGAELVAELPEDHPVRQRLAAGAWPEGIVTVREEKGSAQELRAASARNFDVDIPGSRGLLFNDVGLSLISGSQQYLTASDGLGTTRFRVLLNEDGHRRPVNNSYSIQQLNYARVYGGLVLFSAGTQLMAVDTLRSGSSAAGHVLWTQDLNDHLASPINARSLVPRALNAKWGRTRFVAEDATGRRLGMVGPLTENGAYFQRLHDLHCVDPITGKTIWTRKNMPQGLFLFGDSEYLFAAPSGHGETFVMRAATGEMLGTRKLPPLEDRMTTLGGQVLCWTTAAGKITMEMRDLVADKVAWSYTFAAGSKADVLPQQVVGVMQPDGEFSLVRLSDGERVVHEKLQKENQLSTIYVLPFEEGYLLATHGRPPRDAQFSVRPYPQSAECQLISGRLYAFDRQTGKRLWPAVSVEHHGLILNQPSDLPVLVMMRQIFEARPTHSRDPKLSVLCIDKRSGRLVYNKDDLPGTNLSSCRLTADPATRRVEIAVPTRQVTLTYTHNALDSQAARSDAQDGQLAARTVAEKPAAPAVQPSPPNDKDAAE